MATMMAACGDDESRREACDRARMELRPDAEEICQRSTSGGSSSSSRSSSWTKGKTAEAASTSRGGFGGSAGSFGGGS